MTTEPRPNLTDDDVINLLVAGCNAHEIATYAGVSAATAWSMISHAHRAYSAPQPRRELSL
ncbi:hypothetical protein [Lysobacter sp. ESA13C]|uniref:hypothetical protein n=1 Tax=Lysobacter sp. ESA13C TaxID=2862676 RepID=UPI001CBF7DE4|nr:hypothetical protein [Lysobacter sp. ESA13C]